MNFERGKNIKKGLKIGLGSKRAFETIEEGIVWLFKFPEEIDDNPFVDWNNSINDSDDHFGTSDWGKLALTKWIKANIKVKELMYEPNFLDNEHLMGLKESKQLVDEFVEFLKWRYNDKIKRYSKILTLIENYDKA